MLAMHPRPASPAPTNVTRSIFDAIADMSCCRKRSGHSRINLTRCCDGSRDSIVVLDGFLNDACIVVVESIGDIVADEIWRNMASSI
jgi:hypothetical protein